MKQSNNFGKLKILQLDSEVQPIVTKTGTDLLSSLLGCV